VRVAAGVGPVGAGERTTTAVLEGLGVRPGEADLTVVQFSTAFCGPCRATRHRLQQLRTTRPGLAYVDVDAESHLDAVRELGVRRTPTLLYLDRGGRLLGRSSGAPRPQELAALVEAHLAPAGARDGRDV
jgi:thiol-disulfide isomerase/thioredoxin